MKKEKVVAIRLTTSQYEALEWARVNTYADETDSKTMSRFVGMLLKRDISLATFARDEMFKKQEAAAKRKAKKATNDTK
jgi:hypothetical protein